MKKQGKFWATSKLNIHEEFWKVYLMKHFLTRCFIGCIYIFYNKDKKRIEKYVE